MPIWNRMMRALLTLVFTVWLTSLSGQPALAEVVLQAPSTLSY